MADKTYHYGIGRRKSATARARLIKGKGEITINDRPAIDYLSGSTRLDWELKTPLRLTGKDSQFDVSLLVQGGGLGGQVGAAQLAISNALSDLNDDLRSTLKKAGLLKRDPREKERKKYGLRSARKKEQYSKR
ncbi:MAG TPA: 30S ribosomal protein S9 [Candidatus Saccharimonadales bacterium]